MAYNPYTNPNDTSGMGMDTRFMKGGEYYQGEADPYQQVANVIEMGGEEGGFRPYWDYDQQKFARQYVDWSPTTRKSWKETQAAQAAPSAMDNPNLVKANEEYWKMVNQRDADAQWVRDQYRQQYNALMDPNNPNIQQAQNYGFAQAAAGAAKRGIQGPMSMAAARNQSEAMGRDRLAQNRQMAMGALAGMGGRVDADQQAIMGALQAIDTQQLSAMNIDLRKVEIAMQDDHYKQELRLALEQRNWNRVFQVLNTTNEVAQTVMKGVSMGMGAG